MTLLPSGNVLAAGGLGSAGTPLGSAEIYSATSATWAATGALGTARGDATATAIAGGFVLVTGGLGASGPLGSTELFNAGAPPLFTNAQNATFVIGSLGSFAITTNSSPAATVTEQGLLPAGLTFVQGAAGSGSATISGAATAIPGSYSVLLVADNGVGRRGH